MKYGIAETLRCLGAVAMIAGTVTIIFLAAAAIVTIIAPAAIAAFFWVASNVPVSMIGVILFGAGLGAFYLGEWICPYKKSESAQ